MTLHTKTGFAAACALMFSAAIAVDAQTVRTEALPRKAEAADFYMNAHRAQSLADGSRLVIYRSPVPREPSALAAALIRPNGAVVRMTAADWIAPEELAPETIGQVYAASMSPDANTLAVSIGWRHAKDGGTTAVAVLRRSQGEWRLSHLIRGLGSTGDLLLTRSGLLLAVTGNRRRAEALGTLPHLLTVLSLDGRVLLEALPAASAGPELETYRNRSRLGVVNGTYTFFDAERGEVSFFDLTNDGRVPAVKPTARNVEVVHASKPTVGLRVIRTTTLTAGGAAPDPDAAIIEDAHVYANGTIAVVRSVAPAENDGVATLVTLQSPDGKSRSWHPDGTFFKPVFWENDRLVGIARGETPESDLIVNSVVFE